MLKRILDAELTLFPAPSDSVIAWRRDLPTTDYPVMGQWTTRRFGYLVPTGEFQWVSVPSTHVVVRVAYPQGHRDELRLEVGPFIGSYQSDPHLILEVDKAEGFRGRWHSTMGSVVHLPSATGTFGEPTQGYFCAFREAG